MQSRPGIVAAIAIVVSLVVGFVWSGYYAWQASIGLDPSAFPAGQLLQSIGVVLFPNLQMAVAGLILGFGMILLLTIATFVLVRRSRRAAVQATNPARRSFLTGALAGTGAAVGAFGAASAGMAARWLYGVGNEGRGWNGPLTQVFGGEVVKTHPEWKDQWKGSRVQAYGRLGRTEWPVSDTVLGTGPLRGEKGTEIVKLALDRAASTTSTPRPTTRRRAASRRSDAHSSASRATALPRHEVLHADGSSAARHAGRHLQAGDRGQPGSARYRLRGSDPRPLLRRGRSAAGPERPRGLRPN